MRWTDEMKVRVLELDALGYETRDIAGILGEEFDVTVTRNAVIGAIHRQQRPEYQRKRSEEDKKIRREMRARKRALNANKITFEAATVDLQPGDTLMIDGRLCEILREPCDVMSLRIDSCRWPISDASPHVFCGQRAVDGCPYCTEHRARAYLPRATPSRVMPSWRFNRRP